jgi:hypothetical protein
MKAVCTKTSRVSAPCSTCGTWPRMVHIQDSTLVLFCELCCPIHSENMVPVGQTQ